MLGIIDNSKPFVYSVRVAEMAKYIMKFHFLLISLKLPR